MGEFRNDFIFCFSLFTIASSVERKRKIGCQLAKKIDEVESVLI